MANVLVALSSMKKIIFLLVIFLVYTIFVNSCPAVTQWDESLIAVFQQITSFLPKYIFMLPDCVLYTAMIIIPIVGFGIFFVRKKLYCDLTILCAIPLVAYLLNCVVKHIVRRPRPPIDLQITSIHPDSFSYVSSHSLVTICLWGMVILYLNKYCKNVRVKVIGNTVSIFWILFVGLSRICVGDHNPSDVVGAYLLGGVILLVCVKTLDYFTKTS